MVAFLPSSLSQCLKLGNGDLLNHNTNAQCMVLPSAGMVAFLPSCLTK
jgi:hypothetical protein